MAGTYGVLDLFDEPFFTGTATSTSDVPGVLPVAIGGHAYMIEPTLFERTTIARFRNPYDQSQEPGEHSLNIQGPWLRSTSSWDLGAGQDFWDYRGSVHNRFRSSKGLDFWTDQHRVQLLHDTRNIRSTAQTNLKAFGVGGYLYVSDGTTVKFTADPTGASPTWSDAGFATGNNVSDFTTDGATIYAAMGAGAVRKSVVGSTSSSAFSAETADHIQYANGRLIAGVGNVLKEINGAGVGSTLKTHNVASFVWSVIMAAPNGIYCSGNVNDRNEVYFVGLKSDGSLDVPLYAMSLPYGETLNAMIFYNGAVVLATSVGIRLGTIGTNNGISYGEAVVIPGGATCLEPQHEFAWFGWTNYDGISTGLGRVNLGNFTDTLVPAYSSDLMATTQGNVPSAASFTFGGVTRRYFAVSGVGYFAEFGSLVASATLEQGWITWTTTEDKVALSVDVRHEPLHGTISISITEEDGSLTTVGTSSTVGTLSPPNPLGVGNVHSEMFDLFLTFTRDPNDATQGPKLRRWTFRGLVTPLRADEIHVPLVLKEAVEVPDAGDGHVVWMDPLAEWQFLKALEQSGVPTIYQHGTQSYTVYVEQVSEPAHDGREWIPGRGMLEGIVMVKLVTL